MLGPIPCGQEDFVIDLDDFEIHPGVTADNLYVILAFNLEDAIAAAWE